MKPVIPVVLVTMIMLFLMRCAEKDSGKVPITTQSEEALKQYLKARDLTDKLRNQEALQYYEKALSFDTTFAMAYLNYAFIYPTAKGFFENLDKAVALADKVSEGERLWILGTQAGVNAKIMEQREYFKKLVTAYPQDERTHNLLGIHYFGQQEWQAAIDAYKKAIEINPDFSQPYNQMGYAYRFLGNYDEAARSFKKYIELIPDDPNPYDSYAELLMKMGKFEASITNYKKALEVNPNFVASHIGIATNLNFLNRHAQARQHLDSLQQMARNDAERRAALFAKAVSYADEGQNDAAIDMLKQAYTIAENNNDNANMAGDLTLIGNILLGEGDSKAASEKFTASLETIKVSPLSDEVKANAERIYLYNNARVAIMENNLETAQKYADSFFEGVKKVNNPNQIRLAHELFGRIALKENNYEKAIEELNQANLQNPYNLYRLAWAYKGTNDSEKVEKYLEMAKNFNALNSFQYAFVRQKVAELQ
jgi:tetratricopeptide (TPR) repeat protein